jgi:hypothetical protein
MKKTRLNDRQNRSPIRRLHAERYLLLALLSFAASVSATRLFLFLTGYPQIGSGELHIAHVLWGGLLLFAACLLPLILANRWSFDTSAVLGGFGVGLFIDEVGKFITSSNDYFYPSAAPIIYVLFLLVVLVFTMVRRPRQQNPRAQLYEILQELEEILDHDLSVEERDRMLARLELARQQNADPDLANLAESLQAALTSRSLVLVRHNPSVYERLRTRWLDLEAHWLSRNRMRFILAGYLAALAGWGLYTSLSALLTLTNSEKVQALINDLINDRLVRNASGLNWFEAHVSIQGSLAILLLVCAVLLILGREQWGVNLALVTILITLTIANLLLFYFDQFSTITNAAFQFLLLLLLLRYRFRFLQLKASI